MPTSNRKKRKLSALDAAPSSDSKRTKPDDNNTSAKSHDHSVPVPLIHERLVEIMRLYKRELIEFSDMVTVVKLWIQLNVPRIEDGDNFGVEIQEETLGELSTFPFVSAAPLFRPCHLTHSHLVIAPRSR